ncbi:RAMP superfamily CRISPR-associated protein [Roseospirillum parvum]|uniref:CRISPR type III-associated protein domain-containing protein n=1 Tax=Roseospirillum parvum TaxID=83401 RepID=A0A1G8FBZ5_9PROT|nr:RAMP superfamily CRISPR-associated protein [Roseospirillum parvum]SDH79668.1 hypothetical protein SAMN05421742_11325 [Roseospirillum parvum]
MTDPIRKHHLTLRLVVRAPVLVHATGMGRLGLDSPTLRDHQGNIVLPGTLVLGRVRAALGELGDLAGVKAEDLNAWFGKEEATRHEPGKRVVFDDLVCLGEPETAQAGGEEIVRIKMDPDKGSVAKGMLQVVEAPFPPGTLVTFCGAVRVVANQEELGRIRQAVETALRWNTQMGALRTLGFGRLVKAEISEPTQTSVPAEMATLDLRPSKDPRKVTVLLRFRQPFCVPEHRLSNNLFESAAIIPGATIKGAIAAQWLAALGKGGGAGIDENLDRDRPDLAANFHRLRVSHFVPVSTTPPGEGPPPLKRRRPVSLPVSLASGPDKSLWDMVGTPDDTLFSDDEGLQAPTFAPDWKPAIDAKADRARGWVAPGRDLRVRTSIDHDKRRVRNTELFAYEMVTPDGFLWAGEIGLDTEMDKDTADQVLEQLKSLIAEPGLWWVGKTKAAADVVWLEAQGLADHIPEGSRNGAGPWTLVLQTPALMLGPELSETSGEADLFTAYQSFFADASNNSLKLEEQWSRHRLWGGAYIWKAYQGGGQYRPFLLTQPGAVFRLEAKSGEAEQCIARWRANGLPLTDKLAKHYGLGDDPIQWWRKTPLVPENGYGAVRVDLDLGQAGIATPKPDEDHPVVIASQGSAA